MKTYQLNTIQDLLKIPGDRRADCFQDMAIALELHELAFGDDAADVKLVGFEWTDDGDRSCTVDDTEGNRLISLEVNK